MTRAHTRSLRHAAAPAFGPARVAPRHPASPPSAAVFSGGLRVKERFLRFKLTAGAPGARPIGWPSQNLKVLLPKRTAPDGWSAPSTTSLRKR